MSDPENREKFAEKLHEVLSPQRINAVGRKCQQSERLRKVTPFRLVVALLVALGARKSSQSRIFSGSSISSTRSTTAKPAVRELNFALTLLK